MTSFSHKRWLVANNARDFRSQQWKPEYFRLTCTACDKSVDLQGSDKAVSWISAHKRTVHAGEFEAVFVKQERIKV